LIENVHYTFAEYQQINKERFTDLHGVVEKRSFAVLRKSDAEPVSSDK